MPDVPPEFLRQYLLGNRQGKSVVNDVLSVGGNLLRDRGHTSDQVTLPGARRDPSPDMMSTIREMASRVEVQSTRTVDAVRILEDPLMVVSREDWSDVRSPSRAARRRRQGHPQRIRYVVQPMREVWTIDGGNTLVMHPSLAEELRAKEREMSSRISQESEAILSGILFGRSSR